MKLSIDYFAKEGRIRSLSLFFLEMIVRYTNSTFVEMFDLLCYESLVLKPISKIKGFMKNDLNVDTLF